MKPDTVRKILRMFYLNNIPHDKEYIVYADDIKDQATLCVYKIGHQYLCKIRGHDVKNGHVLVMYSGRVYDSVDHDANAIAYNILINNGTRDMMQEHIKEE